MPLAAIPFLGCGGNLFGLRRDGDLPGEAADFQAVGLYVLGQTPVLLRGLEMIAPEAHLHTGGGGEAHGVAVEAVCLVQQEKHAIVVLIALRLRSPPPTACPMLTVLP